MSAEALFRVRLAADVEEVQSRLRAHLQGPVAAPRLHEAMSYVLLGGGKRLRPLLCLWTSDALGGRRDDGLWAAALALEMLHSYSLVHDDLPAMDDDDLRRGQPSCHRRFDEATAILTGDALQSDAFLLLSRHPSQPLAAALVAELAQAAGATGMAAGQQLDLEAGHQAGSAAALANVHRLKTGRLLAASMAMGALCAGAAPAAVDRVRRCGEDAGFAFQIVDDVLDATRSAAELGKSAGKDQRQRKLTALSVFGGVEAASAQARALMQEVQASLRPLLRPDALLPQLLEHLAARVN